MPAPRRIARLERVVLETAATTIQRDLADPRLGVVTVLRVKLASDLASATVFWSTLGTPAQQRTCARALEAARPRIQSAVAGALGTRVTPSLRFQFDASLERAERLEGLFDLIRRERGETAAPKAEGTPPPPEPEGEGEGEVRG